MPHQGHRTRPPLRTLAQSAGSIYGPGRVPRRVDDCFCQSRTEAPPLARRHTMNRASARYSRRVTSVSVLGRCWPSSWVPCRRAHDSDLRSDGVIVPPTDTGAVDACSHGQAVEAERVCRVRTAAKAPGAVQAQDARLCRASIVRRMTILDASPQAWSGASRQRKRVFPLMRRPPVRQRHRALLDAAPVEADLVDYGLDQTRRLSSWPPSTLKHLSVTVLASARWPCWLRVQ